MNHSKIENTGASMSEPGSFVRVLTFGKALVEIEHEILRVVGEGKRVLLSTLERLTDLDTGTDSRNAAIAEWAEGLSREHGLDWRRVGRDVLFTSAR